MRKKLIVFLVPFLYSPFYSILNLFLSLSIFLALFLFLSFSQSLSLFLSLSLSLQLSYCALNFSLNLLYQVYRETRFSQLLIKIKVRFFLFIYMIIYSLNILSVYRSGFEIQKQEFFGCFLS